MQMDVAFQMTVSAYMGLAATNSGHQQDAIGSWCDYIRNTYHVNPIKYHGLAHLVLGSDAISSSAAHQCISIMSTRTALLN